MMQQTLAAVRAHCDLVPEIGLVLGSGLGSLAGDVAALFTADYAHLPGFPRATVPGHAGRMVLGRLEGRGVCVLAGRFHAYEGYAMRQVTAGVRLLADLGARVVLLTNAAGSLNPRFAPGDLMLIEDQLNLMWASPLVGRAPEQVHDMFPDMSLPFDRSLLRLAREVALAEGVPCVEGVYAGVVGPSYETPAEVDLLRRAGADAVGMSTVLEVIAARERGLAVAGISLLTNEAARRRGPVLDHGDVLRAARTAVPRLQTLIKGFLRALPG